MSWNPTLCLLSSSSKHTCPHKHLHKNVQKTHMIIVSVEKWKQPKCLLTEKWLCETWYFRDYSEREPHYYGNQTTLSESGQIHNGHLVQDATTRVHRMAKPTKQESRAPVLRTTTLSCGKVKSTDYKRHTLLSSWLYLPNLGNTPKSSEPLAHLTVQSYNNYVN